jgi:hypothetical protein
VTATPPPDRIRMMRWAHRCTELADRIRRVAGRCDRDSRASVIAGRPIVSLEKRRYPANSDAAARHYHALVSDTRPCAMCAEGSDRADVPR